MSETGKKERKYYYLQEDGCDDIQIRRYMDLDSLILLLKTQTIHVKRRREFKDENEKFPPLMFAFSIAPCGDYPVVPISGVQNSTKRRKYSELWELLTSCWTKCDYESFLMWKGYTSNIGVCIHSSTHRLLESLVDGDEIKIDDYDVYCGSMQYGKAVSAPMREEWMFWKSREFCDENEFRFYFDFKNDGDKDSSSKDIPIIPHVLIKKVTLTPFINGEASKELALLLQKEYDINVEPSKIQYKK